MPIQDIAIVGAGLGGLVLARILQQHGIAATVYELDESPAARNQGGTLDLYAEGGQWAMREAGLLDQFHRFARVEGEARRVVDKTGKVWLDEVAEEGQVGRPEIDRITLRQILLDSVEPTRIKWGHKLTTVAALAAGRHALAFADGSTVTADLVVGADGAWSRVRPLVSAAQPQYSGLSFLEFRLADVDRRYPMVAAMVGQGSYVALSDNKGLIAQRNGDGSIRVYATLRVAADWLTDCGVDWRDIPAARAAILDLFAGWDDEITALIRCCDDTVIPRPIHALPVGHSWARVPGVTLLGDAAHLMSPFAGEGANLAMRDAADLALAIIANPDDLDAALADYEAAMFPRAAASAAESATNLEAIFRDDSPQGFFDLMANMYARAGSGA
jgi:2-polyprenyl-6-methoxyphenol hydroxylase-like FAD-dependent oxidoreductase